jgi:hypothetical protein
MAKYLKGLRSEDLEEAYLRYLNGFQEKPYPSVQGIQTVLRWSKHPKAKAADPLNFVDRQFVDRLQKQTLK